MSGLRVVSLPDVRIIHSTKDRMKGNTGLHSCLDNEHRSVVAEEEVPHSISVRTHSLGVPSNEESTQQHKSAKEGAVHNK